ncbi:hypothetical protein EDD98_3959 [Streptomyces sp. PanSC19]|nr:hypothetical protein EDD98_3959 [Streptomyces sp. PanSC19]
MNKKPAGGPGRPCHEQCQEQPSAWWWLPARARLLD